MQRELKNSQTMPRSSLQLLAVSHRSGALLQLGTCVHVRKRSVKGRKEGRKGKQVSVLHVFEHANIALFCYFYQVFSVLLHILPC